MSPAKQDLKVTARAFNQLSYMTHSKNIIFIKHDVLETFQETKNQILRDSMIHQACNKSLVKGTINA